MQIYLIRHPKPLDVLGLCYGRRDVAVGADETWIAAAAVRQTLSASVLQDAAIYSSPLSRCVLLARALATQLAPVVDHDLIEMDFGSWEGQAWDTVPRYQLDDWAQDLWGYRPGGGENANALAERWRQFVIRLRPMRRAAVVAVTHAGVIRVALAQAGRGTLSDLAQAPIEFGSVHCFAFPETASAPFDRVRVRA